MGPLQRAFRRVKRQLDDAPAGHDVGVDLSDALFRALSGWI
jgi:hypothetical protein